MTDWLDAPLPSRRNVLGGDLMACSYAPLTGYFRDGCCRGSEGDRGQHVVCAIMTRDFLVYSRSRGNDLTTPRAEHRFPGLHPGDRWCLCAHRWLQAARVGIAPPVVLEATDAQALQVIDLALLLRHAHQPVAP